MERIETATLAGGCFWCTEAIFKRLIGVISVESGYAGGNDQEGEAAPSYEQVSMGNTNYAEAINIKFNPEKISYSVLLKIFFHTHNPTTLNQQGADVGTQYRSAIFYHDEKQRKDAESEKEEFNKNSPYKKDAVTSIEKFTHFYKAENYHQDYYERNKDYPYCTVVIDPKIKKLIKDYSNYVKKEYVE